MAAKKLTAWLGVLFVLSVISTALSAEPDMEGYPPIYGNWQTITTQNGLPNNHIYWVEVDKLRKDRIWLGTDNGLACYYPETGAVKVWQPKDGLGHQAVMCVKVDPKTGDVWAATFGGLSWLSGGKVVKTFTQFNSGLANNVVYGVAVQGDTIWAATTGGTSRYIPRTDEWTIYTTLNMPTEENWCYNVDAHDGKVFIAAWGGGIIEYDVATNYFQEYVDPDGEFEIDLFPDDGLVHNIVTSPSYQAGLLWATTYFGLSVYNFRRWRTYFENDSGLASDFINLGRAQPGTHIGWICTDKGLSVLNYDTNRWVTYKPDKEHHGGGITELWNGSKLVKSWKTKTGIAHNFVLSVDFQGENDVWVGTSHGLSHGSRRPEQLGMK